MVPGMASFLRKKSLKQMGRSLSTKWIREKRTCHCGEKKAQFSWERKSTGLQARTEAEMGHEYRQSRTKPSGVKVKLFFGSARTLGEA